MQDVCPKCKGETHRKWKCHSLAWCWTVIWTVAWFHAYFGFWKLIWLLTHWQLFLSLQNLINTVSLQQLLYMTKNARKLNWNMFLWMRSACRRICLLTLKHCCRQRKRMCPVHAQFFWATLVRNILSITKKSAAL